MKIRIKRKYVIMALVGIIVLSLQLLIAVLMLNRVIADDETEIPESQEIKYEADEVLEAQLLENFLENQGLDEYSCRVITESGETVYFHYYTESVTKPATCQEAGYIDRVCSACGRHEHVEIPVIDHYYENGVCIMCGRYEDGLETAAVGNEPDTENGTLKNTAPEENEEPAEPAESGSREEENDGEMTAEPAEAEREVNFMEEDREN